MKKLVFLLFFVGLILFWINHKGTETKKKVYPCHGKITKVDAG